MFNRGAQNSSKKGDRNPAVTLFVVLLFLISLIHTPLAAANPLTNARRSFAQGDLPTAAKTLETNLYPRAKLKGRELNEALELYGVTQFTLGNRGKAERAFKDLLRNDPSVKLDKRYILDPAVEPFFASIKGSSKDNKTSSTPRGSRKRSARPTPPPETNRSVRENAPEPPQKKVTTALEVTSNAPRTTVFADGIFIGAGGQKISLEPGSHQLTISAEGYQTLEKKVQISSGQTLKLRVNLIKNSDLEKAQEQREVAAVAKAQRKSSKKDTDFTRNKSKKAFNFDAELPQEKKAAKRARSRKSLADNFFQESAPPPQPAPVYPSTPQAPMPTYPQPYQQPQYPYPQAPGYGAPAYPQPGYGVPYQQPSPPPSYGYPPMDPYAPPAYSQPPPPRDYGAPNPYEEDYEAADGGAPRDAYARSPYPSTSSRRRGRNSRSSALALLPLGVGQFQNEQSTKGIIFMLAQGGLLGYGLFVKLKVLPDAEKKFAIDRETEIENKATQDDIDAAEVLRLKYLKDNTNIVNYCLIGAGAAYAIGVIDAFMNLDTPAPRSRAELTPTPAPKLYRFGLQPRLDGGVDVRFSLLLD